MTWKELQAKARAALVAKPEIKGDLIDLLSLARMEIDDGGSEDHECDLAANDIDELLK